jgi:NAD(P)-dependent dehydrogenase (short-subunit alcohol dehydrogenase family)
MVQLDVVQSRNATLVKTQPIVAVFVGGTAGIGECAARALAATHAKSDGKGLRLYIVGRNEDAGNKIVSDCQEVCPTGQFKFVRANDLSLLKDVDRVCAEIVRAEEKEVKVTGGPVKVDLLVLTQGFLTFESRRGKSIISFII